MERSSWWTGGLPSEKVITPTLAIENPPFFVIRNRLQIDFTLFYEILQVKYFLSNQNFYPISFASVVFCLSINIFLCLILVSVSTKFHMRLTKQKYKNRILAKKSVA
jgi:hypothetical protein